MFGGAGWYGGWEKVYGLAVEIESHEKLKAQSSKLKVGIVGSMPGGIIFIGLELVL